ncbi:peptide chain release factor 1 [Parachlamydia sp. AcF125]|uniref:peptide chain release factor 1 n=1 Tax=Parachlamydia sp. AcF125 TaxID=2795736 RepID=UPI001BC9B3AF|nr:peptide chain release factor 1 [Parachlamydia sp. AcF125]MBS4168781.1 Peptide chain release factor RF1 [Parachlamydia sp. AcF125]
MEAKITKLLSKLPDLEETLGKPEIFQDQKQYRALTQEHAYLTELKSVWEKMIKSKKQIEDNQEMLVDEANAELKEVLEEDTRHLRSLVEKLQVDLENLLVPPDPNDHRNTIVELRAGTGGDEAALFVGDCVRMYKLYADSKGWRYELLSCTPSEMGGYKEYVMVLSGQNVYRFLHYEGGTHRVQRVPETEAQGRVHTSAITVAILLEPDEDTDVVIDEKDLRVDTYRSSGAGGQHVNTTDSAVRLTHAPTGIVVYCQEERSQHKNKEKALRLLKAKIVEVEQKKKQEEIASNRSQQVGSGDRSERIRTYNFPQNRITDHRINLTRYNLDRVMEGDLDEIALALVSHFHQEKLKL